MKNQDNNKRNYNKNLVTKSVFTVNLLNGGYPTGYSNVILRHIEEQNTSGEILIKSSETNSGENSVSVKQKFRARIYDIPCIVPEVNISINLKLEGLESIEDQDILQWICDFQEIQKKELWSNEAGQNFLKYITKSSIYSGLESCKSLDECFDKLCQMKYPQDKTFSLQRSLQSIKQDHYYCIKDYYSALVEITKKLSICQRWSRAEMNRRLEESLA